MDSKPPATTTGILSTTTCFAALAMAIMPDEHCRSTLVPLTLAGKPAAKPLMRPMFQAAVPACMAQPITTSSTSAPSSPARRTASRMTWPPKVGALVLLNAPRNALPIGVRAVETMTASFIMGLPDTGGHCKPLDAWLTMRQRAPICLGSARRRKLRPCEIAFTVARFKVESAPRLVASFALAPY